MQNHTDITMHGSLNTDALCDAMAPRLWAALESKVISLVAGTIEDAVEEAVRDELSHSFNVWDFLDIDEVAQALRDNGDIPSAGDEDDEDEDEDDSPAPINVDMLGAALCDSDIRNQIRSMINTEHLVGMVRDSTRVRDAIALVTAEQMLFGSGRKVVEGL